MTESSGTVVLVDDDQDLLDLSTTWLTGSGYSVQTFGSGQSFLDGLSRVIPDVLCLDLNMPGLSGLETFERLRTHYPQLPVIIVTAVDDVESVVQLMQMGAYDYLVKPLSMSKLVTSVRNAVERYRMVLQLAHLEREAQGGGYRGIIGESAPMRRLFRQLDLLASNDITVLISGESGTGKELVAKAIHEGSGRAAEHFIALNCAAIPESLQESELFGHERGAFTGANARRAGRFEEANGGTLFLDEVAELSPALQAKLLRVLQERRFRRVGGSDELETDIRLLAATHRNLADEVREGRFREDLFFRLAVFELDVPPLRDRGEHDILLLAQTFLANLAGEDEVVPEMAPKARAALAGYSWPGNVRELQNAIHRAFVLCESGLLDVDDLPRRVQPETTVVVPITQVEGSPAAAAADGATELPEAALGRLPNISLEQLERRAIEESLERNRWNLSAVGRQLGVGRTTLYRKLKKFGLK